MSAGLVPPPAATLRRVAPELRLAGLPDAGVAHVLAGDVTRCGHRTAAGWSLWVAPAGDDVADELPARRLCARCVIALPLELRQRLEPTRAEVAAVTRATALALAEELRVRLAELRTAALVDGSAYERVTLPVAELARTPQQAARRG